jgi:outer membrane protein OmpA-like peptidoglycan-associated protein
MVFETIYFDVNKSNISPTAAKGLDWNGMVLKDTPNIKVEIAGHSDASGTETANQAISEKRAQSAKQYIQDKYDIPADRMVVKGYGSSRPIADDKTTEGAAKNRRVEFILIK